MLHGLVLLFLYLQNFILTIKRLVSLCMEPIGVSKLGLKRKQIGCEKYGILSWFHMYYKSIDYSNTADYGLFCGLL